jgi:hypothetical protein
MSSHPPAMKAARVSMIRRFLSFMRNVRTKEFGSLEGAVSPFRELIVPKLNAFAGWVKHNKKQGESQMLRRQTSPHVTPVKQILLKPVNGA